MFEADLEKALLLSKLEYEEHKKVFPMFTISIVNILYDPGSIVPGNILPKSVGNIEKLHEH